jgi:hypothetical protein
MHVKNIITWMTGIAIRGWSLVTAATGIPITAACTIYHIMLVDMEKSCCTYIDEDCFELTDGNENDSNIGTLIKFSS